MRCLILLLFYLAGRQVAGQVLILHEHDKMITLTWQVRPGNFTPVRLEQYGVNFVHDYQDIPYGRAIYGTGGEILGYIGKVGSPVELKNYFYRLKEVYRGGLRRWPRLAMVLKIGPTGILRIREHGKVKEILLTPQYPPAGLEMGYEILDISMMICGPRKYCSLNVYARKRKGEIRQDELEVIGRRLCEIDASLEYFIYARPDSWFIEQPEFPFLYAFDEGYALPDPKTWQPDREEWSIQMICSAGDAGKAPKDIEKQR